MPAGWGGGGKYTVPAQCPGQGVCEAVRSCFGILNPTEIRTSANTIPSNFISDAVSSPFAKYLITKIIVLADGP